MAKRAGIAFKEVSRPIREALTKFGGQPVWIEEPRWPLSRETGRPMRFICQLKLESEFFPGEGLRMAYLFMTDEDEYVDGTWEADGGENAVILQPGGDIHVETAPLFTGPSLYKMTKKLFSSRLAPVPCEYSVDLQMSDEPAVSEDELEGNKIGGTPSFIQGPEYPSSEPWRLLLQLDSTRVPFDVNFGDAGVGYAFLSEDGRRARFLWQCA